MYNTSIRRTTGWITLLTAGMALSAGGPAGAGVDEKITVTPTRAAQKNETKTSVEATSIRVDPDGIVTIASDGATGTVAGGFVAPPGEVVFNNQTDPIANIYLPNPDFANVCTASPVQWMADDLTLISGPCGLTGYALLVAGIMGCGAPTFDVHVELWDGDPCSAGSSLIAGTATDFTGIPNDASGQLVFTTLDPPIDVPGTIWMRAEFSVNDAGWIIAGNTDEAGNVGVPPDAPDLGSTQDFWAEDDTELGCALLFFGGNPYAGFWSTVWCDVGETPTGACCNGTTCSVQTEVDCTTGGGTWQGAFTNCDLNLCQPGACCSGTKFQSCTDGTEATCPNGIFHPGATCAENPCGPYFVVYSNDFFTAQFFVAQPEGRVPGDPPTDIIAADDIAFGPGVPCDLGAYEVIVFGLGNSTDGSTFDTRLALWSNDDRATPDNPADDRPLAEIAGTARTFTAVPADAFGHRLLVVPTEPVTAEDRLWVTVETSPDIGGPGLGGFADPGESLDQFALFNDPPGSNDWTTGLFFGGFTPELCPGDQCIPAGSFRSTFWCAGNPPTGACCDRLAGTCTDGVAEGDCDGRWAPDETCANAGAFSPPCGTHACCFEFLTEGNVICVNLDETDCASNNGALRNGSFCEDPDFVGCPSATCLNQDGECLVANETPGCNDAFCCEEVCSQNATCCDTEWSQACADAAASCRFPGQDTCDNAIAIEGTGVFDFDTTDATQDGPSHTACDSQGGGTDIEKDTWFAWTSTCEGTVFVSTCGLTTVDTMLAAYAGTACPVSGASLLGCDDERCGPQSLITFEALTGQEYLLRVGSRPGNPGGAGQIGISCGPPNNDLCNGAIELGDCCTDTGSPACTDSTCCEAVCACDPFCCTTAWDDACATTGFEDSECGALFLCRDTCAPPCPSGEVSFIAPLDGAVDARMPHEPGDANAVLGITTILASGPTGAEPECWTLCETSSPAVPNDILSVNEVAGEYTIELLRPLAAGEATTITYTDALLAATTGTFHAHPANVNAGGTADANDVLALVGNLAGGTPLPFGLLSRDADHSGIATVIDLLRLIDLLNGSESFAIWNGTDRPTADPDCP